MSTPQITDPVVVNYCNQYLRPAMDLIVSAYRTQISLVNIYSAQGIAARLGSDPTAVVADGSPNDGRISITAGLIESIIGGIGLLNQWAAATTSNDFSTLSTEISGITPTGVSFQAMCTSVAVNPSPRF